MKKQNILYAVLIGLLLAFGGYTIYSARKAETTLAGYRDVLPPEVTYTRTLSLVGNDEDVDNTSNRIVATNTNRSFLRVSATSSINVGLLITVNDMPCNIENMVYWYNNFGAATTAASNMVTASTFSFESEPNSIYTGSVRACGVGGTTSVVTLEGVYR